MTPGDATTRLELRDAAPADLARINVLNKAALPWVSPFSEAQFAPFIDTAPYFRVAAVDGVIVGFLLALEPTSDYDSANFRWFCARYDEFIYIDRIAVAEAYTARGVGTRLYEDVERLARACAPRLACEVNVRPRNARSLAFHRKHGFIEVGRRNVDGGTKMLCMFIKPLNPPNDTQDQTPNTFAGPWIERLAERRADHAWLRERRIDESSRILVLIGRSHLVRHREGHIRPMLLPPSALPDVASGCDRLIFLGNYRGQLCFAADVEEKIGHRLVATLADAELADLRPLGAILAADDAALLAYAHAMVQWHRRHRYCGRCGAPMRSIHGGHQRLCTNPEDGRRVFPRLDPAIIVLVERDERALLGRQSQWPAHRYSTIAGFVEPGESLEDTVVREVAEETGIRISHCQYRSSQPWPFPASLMLGFHAVAENEAISLNDGELEDARWWSRAALAEELEEGTLLLPPPTSIARRLITEWFDRGEQDNLAALAEHAGVHRHGA